MPWHDGLHRKHRAFVEQYLVDLNGTQAAIRAGYSKTSAAETAHEILRRPNVAAAIDAALAERPGITRARVVDELARIGFADIRKVVSWRPEGVTVNDSASLDQDTAAAVAEVSESRAGGLRIKMHDKASALEKLGRVLGMFKDRVEHTGKDGEKLTLEMLVKASYAPDA